MTFPSMESGTQTISQPDSVPIVRVDLATRKLDTVSFYHVTHAPVRVTRAENGMMSMSTQLNPMQVIDDWAAFPDGTVAIVRGRDYHVDWIAPNGTRTTSAKIPFEWQRLTDSAKAYVVDSMRTAAEASMKRIREQTQGTSGASTAAPNAAGGGAGPMIIMRTEGGPPARGGQAPPLPSIDVVSPDQLPDYRPAFTPGSVRADADGNLWIRTSKLVDGGAVYDIVNRKGELTDRVSVPRSRVISGFGPGGVVYMAVLDGGSARLEVARVR
jgi:hypothetical protein